MKTTRSFDISRFESSIRCLFVHFFKPKEKQIEIFDKIETTINALQLVFVTCHDIKSTFPTDVTRATFYLICLYVLAKILQISLGTLRDAKVQEDIRKARDEALKY